MQFLILVGFSSMVWAAGMTILYIMACRELDALKRKAKKNADDAKFYIEHSDSQSAEIHRLEKENARIGADLWLARNYAEKLRNVEVA